MNNKNISIIMCLIIICTTCIGMNFNFQTAAAQEPFEIVYCGEYPQSEVSGAALTENIIDADYDEEGIAYVNGQRYKRIIKKNTSSDFYGYYKYEPIPWRVIKKDSNNMILQANIALDCYAFSSGSAVEWNGSALRKWLNGTFYSQAFANISLKDTFFGGLSDKVSVLSNKELESSEYGLSAKENRIISASDYTEGRGAYIYSLYGHRYASYWTRDTDGEQSYYVTNSGSTEKRNQTYEKNSIVPVINVSESDLYYTYSNPILHYPGFNESKNESVWSSVNFGTYPVKELTGSSITSSIINASYDTEGVAVISGQKVKRLLVNSKYRYFLYEPIKWKVIGYNDMSMTLVSDSIIEVFNGTDSAGIFSGSSLDNFLNKDFLMDAFNEKEQSVILSDIRLISDEIIDSCDTGFCSNKTRCLSITNYAKVAGKFSKTDFCPYWIQSDNAEQYLCGYVNKEGTPIYSVYSGIKGVVPVLKIKKYPYVWKADKDVNSNQIEKGTESSGDKNENPSEGNTENGNSSNSGKVNDIIENNVITFTSKRPTGLKIVNKTYNSQRISWKKISGVSNYAVYVSTKRNGTYKLLCTTKNGSIIRKKLSVGKHYYYRIIGYKVANGNVQYSRISSIIEKKAGLPSKPTIKVSRKRGKGNTYVFIKWNISNANYVQIYRKKSGEKYKKILDSKLKKKYKKGVTIRYAYMHGKYTYKVRVYNKSGKKKIYSGFSKSKKIRV